MSSYTSIDLSKLVPPDVVEALDFESVLSDLKSDLAAAVAEFGAQLDLESEPATMLLEVFAYRELILRARVNDAAKAVMLATASGADLDNLAALFGVQRLELQPADPEATPPVPAVMETDAAFRSRVQLSLEAQSTAGPSGAYLFHARSSSEQVKDASVGSPSPGDVLITVLSQDGDGTAPEGLLSTVEGVVSADDVRPLTDNVTVQGATILDYQVEAVLTLYEGPDAEVVRAASEAAVAAYVDGHHRLGHDITLSGLYAALHGPGVQRVELVSPAADIEVGDTEAAHCSAVSVTLGGRDV